MNAPHAAPLLTLVRGGRADVRAHLAARHPGAVVLDADPRLTLPLGGARTLLAALRAGLGDAAVEAAVAPHRALLSLTLRGLSASLDAAETAQRRHASARFLATLPGTGISARPLLEAWADALAALLARCPVAVVIPDASRVDPGTLALIRPLLRRLEPSSRPVVAVGEPDAADDGPADDVDRRVAEINAAEVALLRALPGVRVERAAATGAPWAAAPPVDPLDDGSERRAADALAAGSVGAERAAVLAALRDSFAGFGFATALRLADALLAADPFDPDGAELHTLAFLAALHLAPPRDAAHPLSRRADAHLRAAAALESDPGRRVHLLFRQCVRATRGGGDLAAARALADLGVAAADRGAGMPRARAALLGAWCRNARALAWFREGRGAEAAADCAAALVALEGCDDPAEVPAAEVEVARFHLLNNLARLAFEAGDRAAAARWQDLALASELAIPPRRRTTFRWYDLALDLGDPDAAADRYAGRLRDAREAWDLPLAALYAHDLATIHLRRGDAPAALARFEEVLALAPRLGWDPDDRFHAVVNVAVTAFRAGRLARSAEAFAAALDDPCAADPGAQASLRAASATVAAHRGDEAGAADDAALALAAAEGLDDDVVAPVLRSVGDAWAALGRRGEARAAYERGVALRGGVAAEDGLGLGLGLRDAGRRDHGLVDELLALCPRALASVDAGWDLPRLLRALLEVGGEGFFDGGADRAERARALAGAAARRVDAGALAGELAGRWSR
jgi:tetratricopeptide (TPR) repeat protein